MSIQLVPVGDTGVLAVFEQKIDEEIGAQVAALDAAVRAAKIPGAGETVPAFASLLTRFSPTTARWPERSVRWHGGCRRPNPAPAGW